MKIKIAVSLLALISLVSLASTKGDTMSAAMSFEGGGLPTPCPPTKPGTLCPTFRK
jgi:hypothetical protein